jgi:hypothetical protein
MPGCVRRARMRRSARKRCSNAGASTSHALDGDLLREMSPSHRSPSQTSPMPAAAQQSASGGMDPRARYVAALTFQLAVLIGVQLAQHAREFEQCLHLRVGA